MISTSALPRACRALVALSALSWIVAGPGPGAGAAPGCATGIAVCQEEWTIYGGYYEQGVAAYIPYYGGSVGVSRVLSVALVRPGTGAGSPEQVEFGWRQHVDEQPEWFMYAKVGSTITRDEGGPISAGHTYRIVYDSSVSRFRCYLDGVAVASVPVGSWTTGLPITNLERHDPNDDWNVLDVVFSNLEYRSASTWHYWSELDARLYVDKDSCWDGRWVHNDNSLHYDYQTPPC